MADLGSQSLKPSSNCTGNSSMPWDEISQDHTQALQETLPMEKASVHDGIGSVSEEWRRIGQARRRVLLENDRLNGGTNFELNKSCNVDRYFQVAYRALEQFHKMYRDRRDLEETYIMGYRMVSFLTECLPKHPGFRRPAVSDLRRQSRKDLELLQECLEGLALRIDEEQCDKFVDDFDPVIDEDDSDSECEEVSESASQNWVGFGSWKEGERIVESPTTDTVATCGTGSVEGYELCSSDESDPEQQINFSDYEEKSPSPVYNMMELSSTFLEKVRREDVLYETDSEAADSWAQGPDEDSGAPSSISGNGVTCDPARIVFRELLNRVTKTKLLSPMKGEDSDRSTSSPEEENLLYMRPDPPAQISRQPSEDDQMEPEGHIYPTSRQPQSPVIATESTVESEIQRYLDSSFEDDPDNVYESTMERLKDVSPSKSLSSQSTLTDSACSSNSLATLGKTDKQNSLFEAAPYRTKGWVSFDDRTASQGFKTAGWNMS